MATCGASFPRRVRLTTKADYARVFGQSIRSGDRHLTVLAHANDQGLARLGMTISRKVSKHAVERNRIKRVIRESFRHHQHRLVGRDIVVMGRAGLASLTNAELFVALSSHWKRIIHRCVLPSSA